VNRFCPICNKKLTDHYMIQYNDYFCPTTNDHHFSERIQGSQRKLVKFRVSEGIIRMYCKINYDLGFSEIWQNYENQTRVRINQVFQPNYASVTELIAKLRTYLVFS